jgi:DNA-binding CsgD family transcriptional regulator
MIAMLLERAGETTCIQGLVCSAVAGAGGAVAIEGPAGVGKTALMTVAADEARAAGMQIARAVGGPLERDLPFGVARQCLEPLVRRIPSDERDRLFDGTAAPAAGLLGLARAGGETEIADDSAAIVHALFWLVANLADRRPLLVIADDAHWSDLPSLRFLSFLARRVTDLPVALFIGSRPPEGPGTDLVAALLAERTVQLLTPTALTRSAVDDLVAERLGPDTDEEFCSACYETTGGNPFYTLSLLDALAGAGIEPRASAVHDVLEVGAAGAGRAVLRRLSAMPGPALDLARAVAVLGIDAEPGLAAAVARLSTDVATEAIDTLVRAHLLVDERPLRFSHPIVAAAVRDDLGPSRRSRLHADAARRLLAAGAAPARAATHLLATDPAGDPDVAAVLEAAGRDAAARGAPESAVPILERALAEPAAPGRRPHLLAELGTLESHLGRPDGAEHLRTALQLVTDEDDRLHIALGLRVALARLGKGAVAIRELATLLPTFGHDARQRLAGTLAGAGMTGTDAGPLAEPYLAELREAIRRGDAMADEEVVMGCLTLAAHDDVAGQSADLTAALFDRYMSVESTSPPWWVSSAVTTLILADRDVASPVLEWALGLVERDGSVFDRGILLTTRAWLRLRQGEVAAAEMDATLSVDAYDLAGATAYVPGPLGYYVDTLVLRGELAAAEALLVERAVTGSLDSVPAEVLWLEAARGRLRHAQGRFVEAAADLRAAGDRAIATCTPSPAWEDWRSHLAEALARSGRFDEALEVAEEDVARAQAYGTPRVVGASLVGLAAADPAHAEDYLVAAMDALAGSPAPLVRVRAGIALGNARRRRNDRAAALATLTAAVDEATACGAIGLAELGRAELVAAGGRPRRARVTGRDALTPAEQRVAALAADGHTNKQVAQAMFLTVKTVETHLARTYQKLGIKGRQQLAAALAAP